MPERKIEAGGSVDVDKTFLDEVQERTFQFFWETTNPDNGLTPDRTSNPSFSSIAAVGFALTAYGVGAERGYITRDQAAERTLTTLQFFLNSDKGSEAAGVTGYKGFFYHFLDMNTGHRYQNTELSTIDTSLLMAGVLFAQSYFDRDEATENHIRMYADSLYRQMDWGWFTDDQGYVMMGWRPGSGFTQAKWQGYNEAMILYILALGSPTHPLSRESWEAWTSTYRWDTFYGYDFVQFSPLFGHQYSHIWIDFRGIQDAYMRSKGIDYFENSRRATYAQRAYAMDNPMGWKGYSENIWGLTPCDGPAGITREVNGEERRFRTYWARGASKGDIRDDGTIAPTAAGGSMPFAPEICAPALKAMHNQYGDLLFTRYGFLDAFNPTFTFTDATLQRGSIDPGRGWGDDNYLGIDQGPILLMIENYRTGFVWEVMKRSPYIRAGLKKAGFSG